MDNIEKPTPSPKYWMSLEQWRQDPEFLKFAEQEFQSSPLRSEDGKDAWARREFLKLMGASLALTTFGCVRRPAQLIIPYASRPVEVVPGIPDYYASSFVDGVEGFGLLVMTREGRPIKVEGNTEHPLNMGGMSARAHAHIMRLYDPDRLTGPKHNLQNSKRTNFEPIDVKWEDLDKAVIEQLKKGGVGVLMATDLSPTTRLLVDDFVKAYGAKVYIYDDESYDGLAEAQARSFGDAVLPGYEIEKARYIVAVNNDFLGTWLTPTTAQRQFMAGRKATKDMNKLVVFEGLLSLTGTNADERHRIRPSQSLDVIMSLLHNLVVEKKLSKYAGDAQVHQVLADYMKTQPNLGVDVAPIADELWKHRGESLVLAGGVSAGSENAVELQVATDFLNAVLENDGKTIVGRGRVIASIPKNQLGMKDLIPALQSKAIKTLVIHGCNPAFSLPPEAGFTEAMGQSEMVIYVGDRNDETGCYADYVATASHQMENWSDLEARKGIISIQQPTIRPLFNTRGFQDSLLTWVKGSTKAPARAKKANLWYDYLSNNWRESMYTAQKRLGKTKKVFEDFWIDFLQAGVVEEPAHAEGARAFKVGALKGIQPAKKIDGYELALYSTVGLRSGSLANVSWLQEFPDPITKITWDNYASLSVRDAHNLKVKEGQHIRLTVGKAEVEVPVHVQPGQADGVIGLALGYGHKGAGQVADGVGVNAMTLAQWQNGRKVTSSLAVTATPLKKRENMSCVQGHQTMAGRQLIVEETLQEHLKNPGGRIERIATPSMWSKHKYPVHKWGMVIDLNSCTGCGACMIACQSENNIPSVGKLNVYWGREMHWLRVDRYYVGEPENPDTVFQPIVCMHCDNAPCETVCPVMATVHSDEGTNDMIYNRCVGTRYCSNNCPYKVRRFNWFNYAEGIQYPKELALNPEVTVRSRGIMEKCTFCIHRIRFEEFRHKVKNEELKDGDIITACQQSCPTHAITFGDLKDPNSAVSKMFNQPISYPLLQELNTQPSVHYQVKVRNTVALKDEEKTSEEGHHA